MLSARCGELGLPIDRNVIAKLENGHRNSVTVDEVCVLAAALGVPRSCCCSASGTEETAEVLPGDHASVVRRRRVVQRRGAAALAVTPGAARLGVGAAEPVPRL